MQLGQGAAAVLDSGGDLGSGGGDAPVQSADLGDQLAGEMAQGGGYRGPRAHRAQQLGCGLSAQAGRCSAGQELGEQHGSRLIVWVRVLTRSSRCSTRARSANR